MSQLPPRSALYLMDAFGLQNPWVLEALREGRLSDLCRACGGERIVISRPCGCAESGPSAWRICDQQCTRETGCVHCRRRCSLCHGRGAPPDEVFAEDFGDDEAKLIATTLFPATMLHHGKRSDRAARAM